LLFEKLLDVENQMISFRIIGTTSIDKMFIKLRKLSILGRLSNGGLIVCAPNFE
jgi:hypothetical protein